MRVLVADDHPVALRGLEAILEGAGFEVVGRARTGREALRLIRELSPDVAVVDVALPELSGMEVARRAGVPVVLVSMYAEEVLVQEAAAAGAAYIAKMASADEIVEAVRSAAEGKAPPAEIPSPSRVTHQASPLTPREREVVKLLCEGKKVTEIAEILSRSPATIRAQKASAMRKLGVHSTAELIRRARALGIFPA